MNNISQSTSLKIAVLTVSDTRTPETDKSGQFLKGAAREAGHNVTAHKIVTDDVGLIRQQVKQWVNRQIQVILVTGGTGFAHRDVTYEALVTEFDRTIPGFGELFRMISYEEIGSSTIQSRAVAGFIKQTVVFAMPGSTGACSTAWNKIIHEQLDSSHKPCNFVDVLSAN